MIRNLTPRSQRTASDPQHVKSKIDDTELSPKKKKGSLKVSKVSSRDKSEEIDVKRKLLEEEKKGIEAQKKELEEIKKEIEKKKKEAEEERKKEWDAFLKAQKHFEKEKKAMEREIQLKKKQLEKEKSSLEEEKKSFDKKKLKRSKSVEKKKTLERKRISSKRNSNSLVLSEPTGFMQKLHVDPDFNWNASNPNEIFTLETKLGRGASGIVYKATHIETGYTMAIKIIEELDEELEEIKKEIDILKSCRSDHIVHYFGTCKANKSLWILMDYCAGGSVRGLIETLQKGLSEQQIAHICNSTLKGLEYLHSNDIIHRDVKAANILLSGHGEVKLADFGVAEHLQEKQSSRELIGSPFWMAPEVVLNKRYNYKCDLWSLGITAIEMGDGLPPNSSMNPMRAMKMIPVRAPPTFAKPDQWSSVINNFVSRCLNKNPDERPSSKELLEHEFIVGAPGSDILTSCIISVINANRMKEENDLNDNDEEGEGTVVINRGDTTQENSLSQASDVKMSTSESKKEEVCNSQESGEENPFGTIVFNDVEHDETFLNKMDAKHPQEKKDTTSQEETNEIEELREVLEHKLKLVEEDVVQLLSKIGLVLSNDEDPFKKFATYLFDE